MKPQSSNKKTYKMFLLKGLILFLLVIIPFVGFNYLIDPWGIFKTDFSKPIYNDVNHHFVKIRHLINNPKKYDSFLFGSSRVGHINPSLIKNGKYYNLWYPEGLPKEHLDDIKILSKHGIKIKNIVIELDDISYLVDPILHLNQAGKKPYPINEILWTFYFEYLFCIPEFNKIHTNDDIKTHQFFLDIYGSGYSPNQEGEKKIDVNPQEHLKNAVNWQCPVPPYYLDRVDKTIAELKEIKLIAEKNKINLILFITPLNYRVYKSLNHEIYFDFLKKLVNVHEYYDFGGLNEITLADFYYYEPSHYRDIVGNKIIGRIFNNKLGFGVLVNKDNINQHIQNLRNELVKTIVVSKNRQE